MGLYFISGMPPGANFAVENKTMKRHFITTININLIQNLIKL